MSARRNLVVPAVLAGLVLVLFLALKLLSFAGEAAPAARVPAPRAAEPEATALPDSETAAPIALVKETPAASPPAPTPAATEPEAQVFHVVVVDLQSQPVEAAQVEVWRVMGRTHPENPAASEIVWDVRDSVRTDATGRCVVRLARDPDSLLATKDGVGSSGFQSVRRLEQARNADGEAVVMLVPQLQLSGIVLDVGGTPVAGATVVLRSSGASDVHAGGARGVPPMTTGADGRFAQSVDFMRQFELTAAADGRLAGKVVNVKPYDSQAEVTLQLPGDWSIVGTVRDEAGQPVAGASVADVWLTGDEVADETALTNPAAGPHLLVTAGADGTYSIPVRKAGKYLVTAFDKQRPPATPRHASIEGSSAQPVLDFTLRAGRSLTVHVVDPAGHPLPDVNVQLRAAAPALLGVTAFLGPTFQRTRILKCKADGNVLFERLPPDAALEVRGCPSALGTNLPCDSPWQPVPRDASEMQLVVDPEQLAAVTGSIHATVLSSATGQPLDDFQWQVLPEGQGHVAILMPQGAKGAGGQLVVDKLIAGKAYTLLLWAEGLAILDLHGIVATTEGTPVTGTLPLPGTMEVEVVDESGKALAFATVAIERSFRFQRFLALDDAATTDIRGIARAENLSPGHYLLRVDAAGGHGELDLDIGNGEFVRPRVVVKKG